MYLKIQTFYWQSLVLESIKEDKTNSGNTCTYMYS